MKKLLVLLCTVGSLVLAGCATQAPMKGEMQPVAMNSESASDAAISENVRASYMRHHLYTSTESQSINVETKDGVVYLSGTAHSHAQAKKAIRLAAAERGVVRVASKISVPGHRASHRHHRHHHHTSGAAKTTSTTDAAAPAADAAAPAADAATTTTTTTTTDTAAPAAAQ